MVKYRNTLLGLVALAVIATGIYLWDSHGLYGVNVVLRRGGTDWIDLKPDDPRLSSAMRLALRNPAPLAVAGKPKWIVLAPGFEAGELPVLVDGREVETVLLGRIDPRRYRFTVRNDAAGTRGIAEWEAALPKSLLIVNASYFGHRGEPDTPIVSNGNPLGPHTYDARAGAFVDRDGTAVVIDLANGDWKTAFAKADNAMVSYPLLVGADGKSHVKTHSRWLANRSFVGQTRDGRIVIGTTRDAFFPLDGFADFLAASPLNLKTALNLDGGPIAGQSIRAGGRHRRFAAQWEAQVEGDKVSLLRWPLEHATWAMPMVLTVERR